MKSLQSWCQFVYLRGVVVVSAISWDRNQFEMLGREFPPKNAAPVASGKSPLRQGCARLNDAMPAPVLSPSGDVSPRGAPINQNHVDVCPHEHAHAGVTDARAASHSHP